MIKYTVFLLITLSCLGAEQNRFASAHFSHTSDRVALGGHEYYALIATVAHENADTLLGNPHKHHSITALTFSPDDQTVIAGTENGCISVWNINTTQRTHHLKRKFNTAIKRIACSDQSTIVAAQVQGKKCPKTIDITTAKTTNKLMSYHEPVQALQPINDTTIFLSDCYANNVWDLRTNKIVQTIPNQASMTRGVAWDKTSSCIALGKSTNEQGQSVIELWDNRSMQQAGTIVYNGFLSHGIEHLAFSSQSSILGFVADNSVMLVKLNNPDTCYRSKLVLTASALALTGTPQSFFVAQETGHISTVDFPESA